MITNWRDVLTVGLFPQHPRACRAAKSDGGCENIGIETFVFKLVSKRSGQRDEVFGSRRWVWPRVDGYRRELYLADHVPLSM